jgi:hypothetical protein
LKLGDDFAIAIGFEKGHGKRQPLPRWHRSDQIEQEHEQIVRLARRRRERFVMINFEIDESSTIRRGIVD